MLTGVADKATLKVNRGIIRHESRRELKGAHKSVQRRFYLLTIYFIFVYMIVLFLNDIYREITKDFSTLNC